MYAPSRLSLPSTDECVEVCNEAGDVGCSTHLGGSLASSKGELLSNFTQNDSVSRTPRFSE